MRSYFNESQKNGFVLNKLISSKIMYNIGPCLKVVYFASDPLRSYLVSVRQNDIYIYVDHLFLKKYHYIHAGQIIWPITQVSVNISEHIKW